MKRTLATVVSGSLLLFGATISFVSADVGTEVDVHVGAQVNASTNTRGGEDQSDPVRASSTIKVEDSKNNKNGDATSSETRNKEGDHKDATSTDNEITSEEHRSTVASFVKSLLGVANREKGGIGEQVRVVARVQGDSASSTGDAMDEVDGRGPLLTFLIGSDYKSLGVIRSQISTTQNSIDQLKKLVSKTQNASDTAELTTQINVLQDANTKLDAYVQAHENVFSLFGWFVKLFGSN